MVRVGIPTPYTTSSAQANSESFLEGYQVLASLEGPKLDIKFWRIHYQILVISLGAPQVQGHAKEGRNYKMITGPVGN